MKSNLRTATLDACTSQNRIEWRKCIPLVGDQRNLLWGTSKRTIAPDLRHGTYLLAPETRPNRDSFQK